MFNPFINLSFLLIPGASGIINSFMCCPFSFQSKINIVSHSNEYFEISSKEFLIAAVSKFGNFN